MAVKKKKNLNKTDEMKNQITIILTDYGFNMIHDLWERPKNCVKTLLRFGFFSTLSWCLKRN